MEEADNLVEAKLDKAVLLLLDQGLHGVPYVLVEHPGAQLVFGEYPLVV